MARLGTDHSDSAVWLQTGSTPCPVGHWRDFVALTKPRITQMVLITTGIGFLLGTTALPWQALFPWWTLLATLLGTGLCCMASSVFNQIYERDTDALMPRTRTRPLPSGRVNAHDAMAMGIVLAGLGVTVLWLGANALAAILCVLTLASYTHLYTPLKRITWLSTHVGTLPGAMPPVIGFVGATGYLGAEAGVLFLIMLLWQVPHFLAIAWMYREDYARAGIPFLPVVDPSGRRTFRQSLITSGLLLLASLLPWWMGIAGPLYLAVALILGIWFFYLNVQLVRRHSTAAARTMFLASLVHLPVLFAFILLDRMA